VLDDGDGLVQCSHWLEILGTAFREVDPDGQADLLGSEPVCQSGLEWVAYSLCIEKGALKLDPTARGTLYRNVDAFLICPTVNGDSCGNGKNDQFPMLFRIVETCGGRYESVIP